MRFKVPIVKRTYDRNLSGIWCPHSEMVSILAEDGPLAQGLAVVFSFTSPAPPFYIAYNGAGRSCRDSNPAAARYGTLSLFHGGGIRRIKINMLGRARNCDPARDKSCDGPAAPP